MTDWLIDDEPQNLTDRQQLILTFVSKHSHLSKKEIAKELDIGFCTLLRDMAAMSYLINLQDYPEEAIGK